MDTISVNCSNRKSFGRSKLMLGAALALVLGLILQAAPLNVSEAFADSTPNVSFSIQTDKQEYTTGESAHVVVDIAHNSGSMINDVQYEVIVPEGFDNNQEKLKGTIGTLRAGDTQTIELDVPTVAKATTNPVAYFGNALVATGDSSLPLAILLLLVIGAAIATILIMKFCRSKKPPATPILSILLIVSLTSGLSTMGIATAFASDTKVTQSTTKGIALDGQMKSLQATLSYSIASFFDDDENFDNDIPEGIVYQDGVIVLEKDQVVACDFDAISVSIVDGVDVKVGDIVVVPPSYDSGNYTGLSLVVTKTDFSISPHTIFGRDVDDIDQIVKSINMSGEIFGGIADYILADNVTEMTRSRLSSYGRIGDEPNNFSGTLSLEISTDEGNIGVTLTPTLQFNVKYTAGKSIHNGGAGADQHTPGKIHELMLNLSLELTVDLGAKKSFGDENNVIPIGKVFVPVGGSFMGVVGEIGIRPFLNVTSGNIDFTVTSKVDFGVKYDEESGLHLIEPNPTFDVNDPHLDSLELTFDSGLDFVTSIDFNFLTFPLIDIAPEAGPHATITTSHLFENPYCVNIDKVALVGSMEVGKKGTSAFAALKRLFELEELKLSFDLVAIDNPAHFEMQDGRWGRVYECFYSKSRPNEPTLEEYNTVTVPAMSGVRTGSDGKPLSSGGSEGVIAALALDYPKDWNATIDKGSDIQTLTLTSPSGFQIILLEKLGYNGGANNPESKYTLLTETKLDDAKVYLVEQWAGTIRLNGITLVDGKEPGSSPECMIVDDGCIWLRLSREGLGSSSYNVVNPTEEELASVAKIMSSLRRA